MKSLALAFAFAFLVAPLLPAHARPTRLCNSASNNQVLLTDMSPETQSRLFDIATHPASDPDLYQRMWEPIAASAPTTATSFRMVVLTMDPFQDIDEIVRTMRADPAFADVPGISENHNLCFEPGPLPTFMAATEYHNRITNHYFISTTDAENALVDAGSAGPGWERTGQTFRFIPPSVCYATQRVYRFYTPGANSHFYTVDPVECGGLRTSASGWIGEGVAFGATLPVNGQCAANATPLYRLYNNRAAENDSNHRYTPSNVLYEDMRSRGWIGEGVTLCIRQAN